MRFQLVLVLASLLTVSAYGQPPSTAPFRPAPKPEPKKVEAKEIDLVAHKVPHTKDAQLTEPLKLTTDGDLKLSPLEGLGTSLKVDFKTEYVLLFQWEGSGKDMLTPSVEVKDGKTTFVFTRKVGTTDDARQHSRAFVLPVGAVWKVVK